MPGNANITITPFEEFEELKKRHPNARIVDEMELIVYELFRFNYPNVSSFDSEFTSELSKFRKKMIGSNNHELVTYWAYYPWINTIVRIPDRSILYQLRTARNRNLITQQEQRLLGKATVGVAGLSVGSNVVKALAHEGVAALRLADHDHISITNLNRLQAGLPNIGQEKIDWITQTLYELDPYFDIQCYSDGVTDENIYDFMQGLDVLVDEIDDVYMKTRLRIIAREQGIPVIMATDNGDNILLDIERYDKSGNDLPLFHGNLNDKEIETILNQNLTPDESTRFAVKIIDPNYTTVRLIESVAEIGVSLSGVPQLGSTAMSAGNLAATAARKIMTNADLESGKIEVDIEHILSTDEEKERHRMTRAAARNQFSI